MNFVDKQCGGFGAITVSIGPYIAPRPKSSRSTETKLTENVQEIIERTMQNDDEATLKEASHYTSGPVVSY